MARNGSGTYSLPAGNPVVSGTTISSTTHNNTMTDVANALTASIASDGQTVPTANLPMGSNKHTAVGNAAARDEYSVVGQIQDQAYTWCGTAGGTANAITLTSSPSIASYTAGQKFAFISSGANTGAMTVNVDGLGVKSVTKEGATALVANDIPASAVVEITYDGTQFQAFVFGTLVDLASAQTLTNKTLTSPTLTSPAISDGTLSGTLTSTGTLIGGTVNPTTLQQGGVQAVTITGTQTLTNKTVNLASNTLTGTTAEFNTALSDGDFATLAGAETLTNKTLTSPAVNDPVLTLQSTVGISTARRLVYDSGVLKFGDGLNVRSLVTTDSTQTLTNKTISGGTVSDATVSGGTVNADTLQQGGVQAVTTTGTQTLSNKTFNLASNTLTGTTVEFNSALSDDNFATQGGTEVLSNKTLAAPVINNATGIGQISTFLKVIKETVTSSTTLQDDDDFSFVSAINRVYILEFDIFVQGDLSLHGLKVALATTELSEIKVLGSLIGDGGDVKSAQASDISSAELNFTAAEFPSSTTGKLHIYARVQVGIGGTATVKLQFAQSTASATGVSFDENSRMQRTLIDVII